MDIYVANSNIKLVASCEDAKESEFIHIGAGSKWTVVSKEQDVINLVSVLFEKQEDGVEVSIDFESYTTLFADDFDRLFEYRMTL